MSHKGFCQSVKGLKKAFDAEIADTVSTVKTEIVYRGKQGQKTNELMKDISGFHEEEVIVMTIAEYDALTSGKDYLRPFAIIECLKTVTTMLLDLLKDCEKESDSASSFNNLLEVKK